MSHLNRPRILHTESSPSLGGQELRTLMEMEQLAKRGFESFLLAPPGALILREADRRGLANATVALRGTIDPLAIAQFARFIGRHRIDVVNAHGSKDAWNVAIAARLRGIPVIRSRHIANPIRNSRLSQLVYRPPLCRQVMTTSESIRKGMVEKGISPSSIVSIPTGIDVERFTSGKRGLFRQQFGIPQDVPLIGQIAVLRGSKGPDIFLAAARQLIAMGSPAWFVLVGEGHARARLEAELARNPSHRIILAGYQPNIPDVLADLDVAALTARSPEGVPQAVLQAFAARIPVVASDRGGISEVAIHEQTALLCEPADPAGVAAAMNRLLTDRELRQRLTDNAFELVSQRYRIAHTLDAMEKLYLEIAAGKRPKD